MRSEKNDEKHTHMKTIYRKNLKRNKINKKLNQQFLFIQLQISVYLTKLFQWYHDHDAVTVVDGIIGRF